MEHTGLEGSMPWTQLQEHQPPWEPGVLNASPETELTPHQLWGMVSFIYPLQNEPSQPTCTHLAGAQLWRCPGQAFPACSITGTAQTALICGNDTAGSCATPIFSFSHRGRVVRDQTVGFFVLRVLDEQCPQPPSSPGLLVCSGPHFFSTRGM